MPKRVKRPKPIRYLAEIAIIPTAIILLSSLFWFRLDISLTLLLLFGVWFLDGLVKNSLGFSNETLFADLSFAAFIFGGSQSINLFIRNASGIDPSILVRILVISFILMLFWLGNLSICRSLYQNYLEDESARKSRLWVWVFSALLSFLSTLGAIIPQLLGIT